MNDFQQQQDNRLMEQRTQLGDTVKEKKAYMDGLEAERKGVYENISNTRSKIAKAQAEMELFRSYGEDITHQQRHEFIDLKRTVQNLESYVTGYEKKLPDLRHKLTMSAKDHATAQTDYQIHVAGGGGVAHWLKEELAATPRTKMSHQQKMKYIAQLSPDPQEGKRLLEELSPMI